MKLGIRQKIIFTSFILLILTLGFVTVYSYMLQKNSVDSLMKLTATEKIKELETGLQRSNESIEILKSTLNKNFLRITKGVAEIIAADPELLSTDNMNRLAATLGIDEIHVTDEYGVLRWGNVPDFYGFDFSTSDQTKPFLEILNNSSITLAQDPQQRGADKALFQYIGVSRSDKKGIIQVGVQPTEGIGL